VYTAAVIGGRLDPAGISSWLTAVVALLVGLAPVPQASAAEDPIHVVEHHLANGLTVLLSENHTQAEVFGAVVVDVGSKNDPGHDTGMAHYLEHMLFKGTTELGTSDWDAERPFIAQLETLYAELATTQDEDRRRALSREIDIVSQRAGRFAIPNEFDRLVAELGGTDVNAFTTTDLTAYYNVFPASQIDLWLETYAHRFHEPVFRLFAPELEAVYEEKNSSMDGVIEPAYDAFMGRFFPGHPYGRPILGTIEHLERPSPRAMREHFETWYVANNMALVLSGDFDTETILPIIEEKFGRWRRADVPSRDTPPVAEFRGREQVDVRLSPVRASALGYRGPVRGHADYAALVVAKALLSNEQGSGALDRLVDDGKLLLATVFDIDFHEHDGAVLFFAPKVIGQSFRRAEGLVQAELDRLRSGQLDAATLDAVRRNLLRDIERQWESNEDRVLAMSDTWARGESWSDYLAAVDALEKVAVTDVAAATSRWWADNYLVMRSRRGKPDRARLTKPAFTPVQPVGGQHSEYYRRIHPAADDDVAPRFVDFDTAVTTTTVRPGVTLTANGNPFNSIYRLELRFGLGRRDAPALDVLGDYLVRAGTEMHPGPELAKRLYELATTFEAFATEDRFVLRLEGPERQLTHAIGLLGEVMAAPAADPRRRRRQRLESWAGHRFAKRDPEQIAGVLWEHAIHGDASAEHRYGHRAARRHSVGDLLGAWDEAQKYAVEVRWVGQGKPADVAAMLDTQLPFGAGLRPAAPKQMRPRREFAADQVYFVKRRDAVQSHVWLFIDGEPVAPADVVGMDAYNEYMGGSMGGVIFQEVRELRALAYSAYGAWDEPALKGTPGYFYGYVACQGDKTEETIRLMRELLATSPDRSDRLAAVRSSLLRSQETADPHFRALQPTVETWRDQGYTEDPRRSRIAGYRRLGLADMQAFWRRQLEGRPLVLVVVGDPRRIELDVLERFGPVTVVPQRRLYKPE
jgi:predicted Zn-dependent peptidase